MLPPDHRLTDGPSFQQTVRVGRRAGSRTLVVHLAVGVDASVGVPGPRIGFVVSKAVGNAVVRNRVKRRLRHLAREHISSLPGSAALVVRALPASAAASNDELSADLARCVARVRPEVAG